MPGKASQKSEGNAKEGAEFKACISDGNCDVEEEDTPEEMTRTADKSDFSIKDHIKDIRIVTGRVTTLLLGREGNYKILRYDMKALVSYTAWFTLFSSGTVFTMDNTALLNVLFMVIIGGIACGLTVLGFRHDYDGLTSLKTGPMDELAGQMNAFVPFCLGLYVALILGRWWTLRQLALGKVLEAFANTVMMVSCELHEKKWTTLRNQVAKYGFASVELLIQAAREKNDPSKLVEPGFLGQDEYEVLLEVEGWHRPLVIWSWIMRICTSAMDHHKVPAPRVNSVVNECIRAREGMAMINAHLDTQLPFAYVHLITLLVNMQNLMTSIQTGITFAKGVPERDWFLMGQQFLTLLIVVFIYQALLQISYMIMDPFGDDVLDFPMKAYTHYLANTIDAILEAQPECPVVAEDGCLHRPKIHNEHHHEPPPPLEPLTRSNRRLSS